MTEKNIVTVFQQRIVELGDRPAYRVKQSGKWVARSWREYGERVKAFGMGLMVSGCHHAPTFFRRCRGSCQWALQPGRSRSGWRTSPRPMGQAAAS